MRRKPYFLTWGFLPVSPAAAYSKILLTPTSPDCFWSRKRLMADIVDSWRRTVGCQLIFFFSYFTHSDKKEREKLEYWKWLPKDQETRRAPIRRKILESKLYQAKNLTKLASVRYILVAFFSILLVYTQELSQLWRFEWIKSIHLL